MKTKLNSKFPTEEEAEMFDFSVQRLIRSKAIRLKCLDCCCYQPKEVLKCACKNCPLYPYRLGRAERVPTVTLSQVRITALKSDVTNDHKKNTKKEDKK